MEGFIQSSIVLFVAIDPLGIVPTFISLTEGIPENEKRKIAIYSSVYAFFVALLFIFLSKWVFEYFGINLSHFKIAGGLILLILSIRELLIYGEYYKRRTDGLGVVPIGIPLIVGPATLTAGITLASGFGYAITSISLALNIVLTAIALIFSAKISALIGKGGITALSKIFMLILSSIAVKMILEGIEELIKVIRI
ncbi:MAG: MarC family protein [candidate division WOR-3 bacterium]